MPWALFIPSLPIPLMSKLLIIDDSDPAITYTGSWATLESVGTQTREYNSTVHQSNAARDQLSYTFEGTKITVYGTLDAPGINGSPSPTFSIDGQTPTGFSFNSIPGLLPDAISPYIPLYTSGNLTKGTHTLAISSGTSTNTSVHFYVDFLVVDTGSDSASGNIIVDDRDPSIIYVGNWVNNGGEWEYNFTTSRSPSDVAGGTATFPFNGTSITIYGTTGLSGGANTTASILFAVDGGSGTRFDSPQNSNVMQHTTLFHVAGLSNTQEHTIVMTSLNTNGWWLDYMVYTTRSSSIAGGGGGSGVTGSETGGSEGPNVGAVAGGVVAGVVALLVIAGIVFLHLRKRKHKSNHRSVTVGTGGDFDPSLAPPPFTPPAMGSHALTSPPHMNQYSDGESQQALPPVAEGPGYVNQSLSDPLYPRFDRGVGEGSTSMYQRDSRQDYGQSSGQPSGYKAQYIAPTTPAVNTHRPSPSGVATIEEDSGVRIPVRAPPEYTPINLP